VIVGGAARSYPTAAAALFWKDRASFIVQGPA